MLNVWQALMKAYSVLNDHYKAAFASPLAGFAAVAPTRMRRLAKGA